MSKSIKAVDIASRTDQIEFVVPLAPKGKSRHRTANGRAYTPKDQVRWEQQFALFAAQYRPESPIEGPICLMVTATFSRPKRLRKKKDETERPGRLFHFQKPDADNILKSICDALNDTGWWKDDAQIAFTNVTKYFEEIDGKGPRISCRISKLQNP
jgi:Holliday junction resolvase RusA-like endonuclease